MDHHRGFGARPPRERLRPLVAVADLDALAGGRPDLQRIEAQIRAHLREVVRLRETLEVGVHLLERRAPRHPLSGIAVVASVERAVEFRHRLAGWAIPSTFGSVTEALAASSVECHRGFLTVQHAWSDRRLAPPASLGRARAASRRARTRAEEARTELVRHRLRLGLTATPSLPWAGD